MSSQTSDWSVDQVKAEKASALLRYNRLRNLTNLCRLVEICAVLALLAWTVTRLPFSVRISGELLSRVARVMASPLFVFAICNAIIATLIRRFSGENPGANNAADDNAAETEHDKQFLENNDRIDNNIIDQNDNNNIRWWPGTKILLDNPLFMESKTTEEVVFQDKQTIVASGPNAATDLTCKREESDSGVVFPEENPVVFRRTNSEKLVKERVKQARVLRRSGTEKYKNSFPEDELSAEEFRRAVDEFIAKHSLFRRQETFFSS